MDYFHTFWRVFDFKILIDYERIKTFVHEKKIPLPRFSNMYITNLCNHNCRYCEYRQENKKKTIMPTERVLKNISEVSKLGVKAIDFCGGGEPTLHPDLEKILNYCYKKKIVTGLFTNLAFKNDSLLQTIAQCCSYVRVSLDTFDENKYNHLRRPKSNIFSFNTVIENIKNLVKLKKQYKSKIIIGTKMLLTNLNYQEVEKFIQESINLGVDSVQFKKVCLHPNLSVNLRLQKYTESKLKCLKEKYAKKINLFISLGNSELKIRCFTHINHIFIDALGDVYLCCYYLRRKKKHWLGNVYQKSIKDIWFSDRHLEVAKNTEIRECNRMDCRWIKFNNFLKPFIYEDKLRQLDFV